MVTISLGNKKRSFSSIREAAEVFKMPYITLYMRLRAGVKPSIAVKMPVRVYNKRAA